MDRFIGSPISHIAPAAISCDNARHMGNGFGSLVAVLDLLKNPVRLLLQILDPAHIFLSFQTEATPGRPQSARAPLP